MRGLSSLPTVIPFFGWVLSLDNRQLHAESLAVQDSDGNGIQPLSLQSPSLLPSDNHAPCGQVPMSHATLIQVHL